MTSQLSSPSHFPHPTNLPTPSPTLHTLAPKAANTSLAYRRMSNHTTVHLLFCAVHLLYCVVPWGPRGLGTPPLPAPSRFIPPLPSLLLAHTHPKGSHRLAGNELPNAGPHHCPPVRTPAVGSLACTLELQLPALPAAADNLGSTHTHIHTEAEGCKQSVPPPRLMREDLQRRCAGRRGSTGTQCEQPAPAPGVYDAMHRTIMPTPCNSLQCTPSQFPPGAPSQFSSQSG